MAPPSEQDRTLGDAIDKATLRQDAELRWAQHYREHEMVADEFKLRAADADNIARQRKIEVDRRFGEITVATEKALTASSLANQAALAGIDRRFEQLERAYDASGSASKTALKVALDDHHREHEVHDSAHAREHAATSEALTKAEVATDKRFAGVNEFREQLRDQATRLASTEKVDGIAASLGAQLTALSKEMDRRFEDARLERERAAAQFAVQITELQKTNVARDGQGKGQSVTIATIVTAVAFTATAIGLIITVATLLGGRP